MVQRRPVEIVVWLVVALLALSGCDKLKELTGGEDSKGAASQEESKAEEPVVEAEAPEEEEPEAKEPEAKEEEPAAEEPPKEEEKPALELPSRESFIEVSVVIGCNDLDRTLDLAQRTDLRRQALNQYGFIEETWEQAQQKFKDDPTVRPVLEGRVTTEACASKPAEAAKPTEKDRAVVPANGIYRGAVKGGGVRGTIMLSLKPGRLSGNAKGTRDGGEKWAVGLSGDTRGATFSGSGKNKNTNLRVQGRVDGSKASGTLSGTINGKSASATFTANR